MKHYNHKITPNTGKIEEENKEKVMELEKNTDQRARIKNREDERREGNKIARKNG